MRSAIAIRGALAGLASLLAVANALAAPGLTSEPTVMRAGPGPRYAAIQRVPGSAQVDVESCSPSWCRISWRYRTGYIPAEFLEQQPVPPPVYVEPPPPVVLGPVWGPAWGWGWGPGWGWRGGWRR